MATFTSFPQVTAVILGAGKGTRMKSQLPKVLHTVLNRPMLSWVIESLNIAGVVSQCLVLSQETEPFDSVLNQYPDLGVCIQEHRNGTAGAVASAAPWFQDTPPISYASYQKVKGKAVNSPYFLVCAGDVPGIDSFIIHDFIQDALTRKRDLSVLGISVPEPKGYGRLVRDPKTGDLLKIVEQKDADDATLMIQECNSGIIFGKTSRFFELLSAVTPNNAQKEYYLTDCISLAQTKGYSVGVYLTPQWEPFLGINDQDQLQMVEHLIAKNRK